MRKSDIVWFVAACSLALITAYVGGSPMFKGYLTGPVGEALQQFHTDINRIVFDLSNIRIGNLLSATKDGIAAFFKKYLSIGR